MCSAQTVASRAVIETRGIETDQCEVAPVVLGVARAARLALDARVPAAAIAETLPERRVAGEAALRRRTALAELMAGRALADAPQLLVAWESARYRQRMHVEHWDNALHAPAVAAASLLGGDERYDPVPYFWSEQWGRMVQYAGHHPAGDRLVWREPGDTDGAWAAFWLAGDRLVAAVTVDRPRDLVQARRLMAAGRPVDADLLADPGVAVKAAAT